MLPLRHILFALLSLLVSGGGHGAWAHGESALRPSPESLIGSLTAGQALEAIVFNERIGSGRPLDERTGPKTPVATWTDPYVSPVLPIAAIAALETVSAPAAPRLLTALARAPPFRL